MYKFFRFTWSRQFYESIDQFRDGIKALVYQTLNELGLNQKTPQLNSLVWNRVWAVFKDYNLHYDGTDQFVRNCVNIYFAKRKAGQRIDAHFDPSLLPPKVSQDVMLTRSKPKGQPIIRKNIQNPAKKTGPAHLQRLSENANLSLVEEPAQISKNYFDGYDYIGKLQYDEMDSQETYTQCHYGYIQQIEDALLDNAHPYRDDCECDSDMGCDADRQYKVGNAVLCKVINGAIVGQEEQDNLDEDSSDHIYFEDL